MEINNLEGNVTEIEANKAPTVRNQRLESLGSLAIGIVHDLNNIFSPIILSASLLREKSLSPECEKLIQSIESCSRRGSEMVKRMLAFAKGLEGEETNICTQRELRSATGIILETFSKKYIIDVSIPENLHSIRIEPAQLQQIVLNLAVNARDAMPAGGLIRISARNFEIDSVYAASNSKARPGRYVLFQVEDTGIGISDDKLSLIFEPYFTTKPPGEGTGLGLPTVQAIVEAHQGFIVVNSDVDRGSSFSVFLPAVDGEAIAHPNEEPSPGTARGSGQGILVVDDEEAICEATKDLLEHFGYKAFEAEDGVAAVGKLIEHKEEIQLVITDLFMPVMDGYATIKALKKIKPNIPIIVTSGNCPIEDREVASKLGVQYFLRKPYDSKFLLSKIAEALNPVKKIP